MTDPSSRDIITVLNGFDAMRRFLDHYWERTHKESDDIAALLGSLERDELKGSMPLDPAMWADWLDAVSETIATEPGREVSKAEVPTQGTITVPHGFEAMRCFLGHYWKRGLKESDDIAVLLGSLERTGVGTMHPDQATWPDWADVVTKTRAVERRRAAVRATLKAPVKGTDEQSMLYLWDAEPDLAELHRCHSMLGSSTPEAIEGLSKLVERGSVMSMLYLGDAYGFGRVVQKDIRQAEAWYRRAAENGSAHGSYELGQILHERKEYDTAKEAFEMGSAQDYPPSVGSLGMMYARGDGMPRDLVLARQLLNRAVAKGNVWSKRNLAVLKIKGRYGLAEIPEGIGLFHRSMAEAMRLVWRGGEEHDERLR